MCTHKHYITNKYTGERLLVNCGHCPACLQEKANRLTNLIRCHYDLGQWCLFVTLTYDRISCPYIKHEDLYNRHSGDIIPIYREYSITHSRNKCNKRIYGETRIGQIEYDGFGLNSDGINCFHPITNLKHRPHGGVCYYKDVQNFFKRLRINLKRKYNYEKPISYFSCSEYGSKTKRPHFHLLIFHDPSVDSRQIIRDTIVASWPFASKHRTLRGVEIPRGDCAAYVSSYVNCFTSLSAFLRHNAAPKRTYSKFFGKGRVCSNLAQILEMYESGNFSFSFKKDSFGRNGSVALCPQRNVAFYFPKIKGYRRLSDVEVFEFVSNTARARFYTKKLQYRDDDEVDDYADNQRKLSLGFNRFLAEFGVCDRALYAFYYHRVWARYMSYVNYFKYKMADMMDIPITELFDNVGSVHFGEITSDGITDEMLFDKPLNPNEFPSNIKRSAALEKYFWQRDKQKKVSNTIYSAQGFNI